MFVVGGAEITAELAGTGGCCMDGMLPGGIPPGGIPPGIPGGIPGYGGMPC